MSYWKFFRQDWPLLCFGLLMAALSGPGQTFFVGLFRDDITAHFGISIGDFGLIFSSATLISAAVFFWSGKLVDRWPVRQVTIRFAAIFAASALLIALSPHVAVLALAVFGIRHVGQGLMGHVSGTTMARYFHHNRAKAVSLASMGYSISEAIFPICVVSLLAFVGWRLTWVSISGAIVIVFLPLALWLLARNVRDLSLDQEIAVDPSSQSASDARDEVVNWDRKQVLGDPRFWMIFPALLSGPYLLTGIFFHQASLAAETGLTIEVIAACFTTFALTKMAGSLVFGPIVDKWGYFGPYPFCIGLLGVSMFILTFASGFLWVWSFYVLSGFAVGAGIPVTGTMWPGLYGTRHLGAIRSMLSSVMVLATGLAPASYGYLLDAGVSLQQISLIGAGYCFAVLPLLLAVPVINRKILSKTMH